ncbi:hypothetical protein, partial [Klebsiella aerogenes]|uniref:hypothetical protein n=1 Tax=Klebsiella aerogenes TaxID=548 RepID=UPI001CBDEABE
AEVTLRRNDNVTTSLFVNGWFVDFGVDKDIFHISIMRGQEYSTYRYFEMPLGGQELVFADGVLKFVLKNIDKGGVRR